MYNNNSGFFVLFHKVLMLNTQWWTELNWDRFGSGLAYYIIRRGIFIISAKQQQNLFRFFVHSLERARVKEGAGMEGVSTAGPIPPPPLSSLAVGGQEQLIVVVASFFFRYFVEIE